MAALPPEQTSQDTQQLLMATAVVKDFEHNANASLHTTLGMLSLIKLDELPASKQEFIRIALESCKTLQQQIQRLHDYFPVSEQTNNPVSSLTYIIKILVAFFRQRHPLIPLSNKSNTKNECVIKYAVQDLFHALYQCFIIAYASEPTQISIELKHTPAEIKLCLNLEYTQSLQALQTLDNALKPINASYQIQQTKTATLISIILDSSKGQKTC